MKLCPYERFEKTVRSFKSVRILVVGDLILDEFIRGDVSRISPEAPIPVVWVTSQNFMPGGACNVAHNIRSLGGCAEVVGVVGNDEKGRELLKILGKGGIGISGVMKDPGRPTTLKTRVVARRQQVVRIDREKTDPLSGGLAARLLKYLHSRIPQVDAVCVEDYGKGVITPHLVHEVVQTARKHGKVITVDPKENHLSYYRGVTTITPNHHEAAELSGIPVKDDSSLFRAGNKLLKALKSDNVLVTLGENGMCLFQHGRKPVKIPTLAQEVFDVSGAGDTVIGTYSLALALGTPPLESAHLANCAAGIVVGKVGTAVTTAEELLGRLRQLFGKES